MIALDECIEYCKTTAERYRTAPERIPGPHSEELLKGWERNQEMYELLAKTATIAKNLTTGGNV